MKKLDIKGLIFLISFVSTVEVMLIFLGVLLPVLSYSIENLIFAFLRFSIIIYSGIIAKEWKESAKNGAMVSFSGVIIICVAALLSNLYLKIPVLGLEIPNIESLILMLLVILVQNVVLGIICAILGHYVYKKLINRRT
ncbi:MAG: hypothetical protein WC501_03580 [Candidatus Micrarchaeia archaeon]|jgi:uncharacterized membrane protein